MTNKLPKLIKIKDGIAIDRDGAWIGYIEEQPEATVVKGLFKRTKSTKPAKFYFLFGDGSKSHIYYSDSDSKEEAQAEAKKEWNIILNLINGIEL